MLGGVDALPLARVHQLWDELADFGLSQTEAAMMHFMRVMRDLLQARNATWGARCVLTMMPRRIRSADGAWRR
jgi:hypothetical protein